MKNYIKIFSAVLLTAALSACGGNVPDVSGTTGTAFENHTIMPKVAEEEDTETELPATDFDGGFYDDEDYEIRENDEYEYNVYKDRIVLTNYLGESAVVEIPAEIDGLKVTEIGGMAFALCNELESVTLPNGIEQIGRWAFFSCKSLTKIEIPESVVEIGEIAFGRCESLTKIEIPKSVAEIGDMAFASCDGLKSVTLQDGIEKIGEWAFSECKSLTKIEIPESVTEIGEYAFYDCTELAEISMPENAEIGDYAFSDTAWIENQSQPLIINSRLILWDTAEGDVVIPDGVTRICGGAFFNCSKMTSVAIPESVKGIGGSAFQDCSLLKRLTIPDSVESIETYAFAYCEALEEIIIPDSVTEIEYDAFKCYRLKNVTIPDSFGKEEIKAAFGDTYWFKKLYDETYVEFCQNEEYEYNVYEDHIVLLKYRGYEEQLDLPADIDGISVTEIDDGFYVFEGVTSVAIPNSVTKIGVYAFSYSNLTEVTIPESVTVLGEGAFSGCENLTDVTVPEHFDKKTIKAAFKYTPWYKENYGEE